MLLTVNRAFPRNPPGGHHFIDRGTLIRGEDADKVLEGMRKYRAENSFPLGDPEGELAAFYQVIAPYLVATDGPPTQPAITLAMQCATWNMRAWQKRPELLPETAITKERLQTCYACPHWAKVAEPPADGTPDRDYYRKADRRAVQMVGRIDYLEYGFCDHHHWPILIGARLSQPIGLAADQPIDGCWVTHAD